MASSDRTRKDDARFGIGVSDQRQAKPPKTLAFDARSIKKDKTEELGFDPYNTSGSFDRKKHWVRVGKR
jgi:hypothetical protein